MSWTLWLVPAGCLLLALALLALMWTGRWP